MPRKLIALVVAALMLTACSAAETAPLKSDVFTHLQDKGVMAANPGLTALSDAGYMAYETGKQDDQSWVTYGKCSADKSPEGCRSNFQETTEIPKVMLFVSGEPKAPVTFTGEFRLMFAPGRFAGGRNKVFCAPSERIDSQSIDPSLVPLFAELGKTLTPLGGKNTKEFHGRTWQCDTRKFTKVL